MSRRGAGPHVCVFDKSANVSSLDVQNLINNAAVTEPKQYSARRISNITGVKRQKETKSSFLFNALFLVYFSVRLYVDTGYFLFSTSAASVG